MEQRTLLDRILQPKVLVVMMLAAFALVLFPIYNLKLDQEKDEAKDQAQDEAAIALKQLIDEKGEGDTLEETVDQLPQDIQDDLPEVFQGTPGERGPGPTPGQVAQAVAEYLTANPPQPGRPPTQEEVDAAVARFCAANRCRGADGAPGQDGAPGAGGAPGSSGLPPTDEQVAAAVITYCDAHGECAGPQGQPPTDLVCDPPAGWDPLLNPDQGGWTCTAPTTTTAP